MTIQLNGLGKRFNRDWIFRHLTLTIGQGSTIGILGPNGSGKSTLLHCIWGQTIPTEGSIRYVSANNIIPEEDLHGVITIAAPYMDLIEEFTVEEHIAFHFSFKKTAGNLSLEEVTERIGLAGNSEKKIKDFSSGMRQRLKLGLALLSEASVTFLDEPTTNLDREGEKWYHELISGVSARTLIIATNVEADLPSETTRVIMSDLKKGGK